MYEQLVDPCMMDYKKESAFVSKVRFNKIFKSFMFVANVPGADVPSLPIIISRNTGIVFVQLNDLMLFSDTQENNDQGDKEVLGIEWFYEDDSENDMRRRS